MERTDNFKLKLAEDTDTMRDMVNGINDNFRIIDEQMQNNILGATPQLESILVENDCQGTNHGSIYSIKIQLEFLVGGERFSRTESFEYKSDIDGNYETEINTRAYTVYYIQAYNVDIENGGCHLRITSEEPTNYNLVFGKFETDSEGAYKEGSFEPIQNAFLEKEIKNAKENATANFSKLKINNVFIPCDVIRVESDKIILPPYVKDGVYFPNENAFYQFADGQFADETDYYIYVSGNTVNVSTSSSETAFARFRYTAANDSFEFQYFCNPVFVKQLVTFLDNIENVSNNIELLSDKLDEINDLADEVGNLEYNDVFNIRVHWDRSYMPEAELLVIDFQHYSNGILVNDMIEDDVQNVTSGNVYLYKNTSDTWEMVVGTAPSSYKRTPMLIGRIATKTVNGESVKLFFRNGDDETQFDKLNSEKVDKETGKGLSTNDYTTAEKTKLYGIESGAEANVQSDWNESDSTKDGFIKNKPTIPIVDSSLSGSSTNAIQNKAVKEVLDEKEDAFAVGQGLDMTTVSDNKVLQVEASSDGGIGFDENLKLKVKFDGDTIQTNISGQLEVNKDEIASKDYVDTELAKKVDKQSMSLLCSRTVTNTGETPASVYSFTQDDNGNAFNLSMAQVVVYVPSGANQGGSVVFYSASSRTNSIRQFTISNIRQASVNSGFDIKMLSDNGYWDSTQVGTSAVYLATSSVKNDLVDSTTKIKCIDVTTYQTANGFPAGTKIKIYGVNEND